MFDMRCVRNVFDNKNKAGAMTRQLHTAEHSSFASWYGNLKIPKFHSD